MSNIQEMFLKAADFQIIERPPIDLDMFTVVGYRIKTNAGEYGSYALCRGYLEDGDRMEFESQFKEQALETILTFIGCHA